MYFAEWVESHNTAFIVEVEQVEGTNIHGNIAYKVISTVVMINPTKTTDIIFGVSKHRVLGKNDERIFDDLNSAIRYLIKRIFR